jgi:histidinol dehydrogenase
MRIFLLQNKSPDVFYEEDSCAMKNLNLIKLNLKKSEPKKSESGKSEPKKSESPELKAKKLNFYDFLLNSRKIAANVTKTISIITNQVKKNGDKALIFYSNKLDQTSFKNAKDFLVSPQELLLAEKYLAPEIKEALIFSYKRIASYHQKQLPQDFHFQDEAGVKLGNIWRSIKTVGIYVPGGSASYPSSVLMSAIPAIVAGVDKISMCVPCCNVKNNIATINPAVLFAAKICNIKTIYKIGGAQAIAALAYGTKTVARVDKIVGPGNSYVAGAKKSLFGEVGIDMIAGPTDITIIADNNNNPDWIAADALSQLEHGPDSKAFIITDNKNFAVKVAAAINNLAVKLPRKNIIKKSLANSAIFIIKNLDEAIDIANFIAPEHLEIATVNYKRFLPKIKNAGAVFLGNYTPESIGDYTAGPSHTLPTSASAKFCSGLSVFDFLKRISLISCDKKSFNKLAGATSILAECESLQAHKLSIDIRKT